MSRYDNKRHGGFGGGQIIASLLVLSWLYIDFLFSSQMISLTAAQIAILQMNPPPKKQAEKKFKLTPIALFERLSWKGRLPHDLDIWTRCYGVANGDVSNEMTVGYSRKSDGWLDLLRDDQGGIAINEEQLQSNSEVSRMPPNTLCVFNVHLYHSHGGKLPVDGHMVVIQDKDGDNEIDIADVAFTLESPGQEKTILIARWDDNGNLIPSETQAYPHVATKPIATAKK